MLFVYSYVCILIYLLVITSVICVLTVRDVFPHSARNVPAVEVASSGGLISVLTVRDVFQDVTHMDEDDQMKCLMEMSEKEPEPAKSKTPDLSRSQNVNSQALDGRCLDGWCCCFAFGHC